MKTVSSLHTLAFSFIITVITIPTDANRWLNCDKINVLYELLFPTAVKYLYLQELRTLLAFKIC